MFLKEKFYVILIIFHFASALLIAQNNFYSQLADSALLLTHDEVRYDPSYYCIAYPNGDVPSDRGVCTDVVIRAYSYNFV